MNEKFKDFIEYRIQRSNDTFEDAKLLANNGRWNSVTNRLYYACFYAVSALLYSK
ncbi:HEPN domain-containing protein [bacterium]|nr:HEPN domain-containing protein [bacterium]